MGSSIIRRMVTIEILKKSQRTRPRNWVRNFGWIFIWFFIAFLVLLLGNVIPDYFLTAQLDAYEVNFNGTVYTLSRFLYYLVGPIALWVLGFFPLNLARCMGKYRHINYLLFIPAIIVHVAMPVALGFIYLHDFVPQMTDLIDRFVPADILALIVNITTYVTVGYAGWCVLICFCALLYNLCPPLKYSDIYSLRKARVKSYRDLDERAEYKRRFYDDYKRGNWDSMMLDLHFASIEGTSDKPIPEDAYEFMRYLNGKNQDKINSAILDKYKEEGKYSSIRKIYHSNADLEDNIARGAKINLGPKPKPSKPTPKPAPLPPHEPPLAPSKPKKDPNSKLWGPDDIG